MPFDQRSIVLATLLAVSSGVNADAGHGHGSPIGTPAASGDVTRTVEIEMTDNRYNHPEIDVRKGEVIRFSVHNQGELVHEFNIGTAEMHDSHQGEMLAMMESGKMGPTKVVHGHGATMGHDDPNSILLNPGESGELIWRFEESADALEFACNVPGHYQAGMVGRFHFEH